MLVLARLTLALLVGCGARTVRLDADNRPDAGAASGQDIPTPDAPPLASDGALPPPRDAPVLPTDRPGAPDTCERARPVTLGVPLLAQDTAGLTPTRLECGQLQPASWGAPLWYRVTVPPRRVVTAIAAAAPGANLPMLRFFRACAQNACLASGAMNEPGRVTARWANDDDAPAEVLLALAGYAVEPPVRFDLSVALLSGRTDSSCERPTAVADGSLLRGEDLQNARHAPPWCSSSAAALFYAVHVGPGETLTARATAPAGARDRPTLRLGTTCEADDCVASSVAVDGTSAALTYANGAAAQDFLLTVQPEATGALIFDLAVTVTR